MEPVQFNIEKAFRPSLQYFQQYQEGKALPKNVANMQMDVSTKSLALDQVLVRLTKVTVIDWKSWMRDWFRKEGEADIIVISYVTDGGLDKPYEPQLKPFRHVKRGVPLTIDPNFGVMMYQRSGKIPTYLDMRILIARDRQPMRNIGQALSDIGHNSEYKNATSKLSSLTADPITEVLAQIDTIVGLIGAILKLKSDDQLLYYAATVHRDFDNLGIGDHGDNTPFVDFSYRIQVGRSQKK